LAPVSRLVRYAVPMLLALAAATPTVFADTLVCSPIRRGESATQVARRVTGDSRNAYQTWFQIRNASSRFVPKSQYNRVRAGWHACVFKPIVQRASASMTNEVVSAAPLASDAPVAAAIRQALPSPAAVADSAVLLTGDPTGDMSDSPSARAWQILRAFVSVDFAMVWLGAVIVVPWVGWRMLEGHLVRRKTTTIVMRHFATRFVHEFERPLRWSEAERPLRSRVRYSARRGRLDILLAPGKGRRYPNLSDHKKNVEYDVARVIGALGDASFVNGRLYTQAGWVVVPFQFQTSQARRRAFGAVARPEQPGVTCISSF
jgi:hypothetical protein